MRSQGHAVESICRVLRGQGVAIAARTYRHARATGPSPRTVSDAQLLDTLHGLKGTPESLYGRRRMVAHLRRLGHEVAHCTVDQLMGVAGMAGVSRRKSPSRSKKNQPEDRASDLLHRDFTAAAPNLVWVADFTYVMTTSGWVYVAFIVDVFSQRLVAWHAQTSKGVELVRIPLRLALWERRRGDHPVDRDRLIHHSDAGSQGGFNRSSQHLDLGGVQRWQRQTGTRRPVTYQRSFVGSGVPTGRCGRRCVHLAVRSRPGRYNVSSGD